MVEIGKPPMDFHVWARFGTTPFVWPPIHLATAGGNSVLVKNHTNAPVEVRHNAALNAPDPFTVSAKSAGSAGQAQYTLAAGADVKGTAFPLKFTITSIEIQALAAAGDPEIIIT
jgi:hypothetical protein